VTRRLAALVAVAALLAAMVGVEMRLQSEPRVDPLGRELLYLPTAEMLHLASLGNAGLVADAFYLWSIQYYGQFKPHERFLYLETVYDLITDLDPLYHDAYRIGALIMQIQVGPGDEERQQAVIRLFDKALRNMPDNYDIAEAAAWDMFIRYRDMDQAIRYIEAGVAMPGSPHRLRRALGVWRDREGEMTFDEALKYWQEARGESENDYDRAVCDRQLYRLFASRDEARLNPMLESWSQRTGSCPTSWQPLIDAGLLREVPVDYFGRPYRILPESCSAMGLDQVHLD
jgi:tetratricopeptide (TPR) repeat protein